jgi:hypothetical protein
MISAKTTVIHKGEEKILHRWKMRMRNILNGAHSPFPIDVPSGWGIELIQHVVRDSILFSCI